MRSSCRSRSAGPSTTCRLRCSAIRSRCSDHGFGSARPERLEGTDPVFDAFCAAGLWPGLGRTLAAALAEAGIHSPKDVSTHSLTGLPKIGAVRAGRLFSAFLAAGPTYEVAELLFAAGLEVRLARRVIDAFGPPAPRLVRDDPWSLLTITGFSVDDADRVARAAIPNVRRDDPRRGRGLVAYVLAREASQGHTVTRPSEVLDALGEFGVPDTDRRGRRRGRVGHAWSRSSREEHLLALARYAQAEDAIAVALARLIATRRADRGQAQPRAARRSGAARP